MVDHEQTSSDPQKVAIFGASPTTARTMKALLSLSSEQQVTEIAATADEAVDAINHMAAEPDDQPDAIIVDPAFDYGSRPADNARAVGKALLGARENSGFDPKVISYSNQPHLAELGLHVDTQASPGDLARISDIVDKTIHPED